MKGKAMQFNKDRILFSPQANDVTLYKKFKFYGTSLLQYYLYENEGAALLN